MRLLTPNVLVALWVAATMLSPQADASVVQSIASYGTVLSLAGAGTKFKWNMEGHAVQMAEQSTQAVAWQEAAGQEEMAAEELEAEAVADEEEGAVLESEGEAMAAKGHTDEALAVDEFADADALAVQAGEEEAGADGLLAEAGAEEVVAEEEGTAAVATAALAAKNQAIAEVDEAATAACNIIPLLDVVCDVVGGIAAAALETNSVREAAEAVEEFAAAATTQAEADAMFGEAAELQAASVADGGAATELEGQAADFEAQAKGEFAEAEADEIAAKEELAKGAAEEEEAADLQVKAAEDETESANAWRRAAEFGALTLRDGIVSAGLSLAALLYFGLRIFFWWVVPAVKLAGGALLRALPLRHYASSPAKASGDSPSINLPWVASHFFHHGFIFFVTLGWFGSWVMALPSLTMRSVGGIFVWFAITVAALHGLLFAVPKAHQHYALVQRWSSAVRVGFLELSRRMLWVCPLVILEILFLWINVGLPSADTIELSQQPFLWTILGVTVVAHVCCFAQSITPTVSTLESEEESTPTGLDSASCHLLRTENGEDSTKYGTNEPVYHVDDDDISCDASAVLEMQQEVLLEEFHLSPSDLGLSPSPVATKSEEPRFHVQVFQDWKLLMLPFELVMGSAMFALVRQALPTAAKLWPTSEHLLIALIPSSVVVGLSVVAGVALLLSFFCCHLRSLPRR